MATNWNEMIIRKIEPGDNPAIAKIIRDTLNEFGAARPGTVYFDPTTDKLFELFEMPKSIYYVADESGQVLGGAGIFPTSNLPEGICELVKMYLLPMARGKGIGRALMEHCFRFARENGFSDIYLETMPELKDALKVYEKFGFSYLDRPLGDSGHFGCGLWMIKKMQAAE